MKHKPLNRTDVINTLRQHLPDLLKRYGVRTLGVFGSYARREARSRSDLDLLVEFDHPPSLLRFIEMEQHLTDLLGVKVDLVMKDALKPSIGRRILSEVVPL